MKANNFAKADEAVSPVIGVILMVAITVVLAAVVFVLVSDLGDTGDAAPEIGFAIQESEDRIRVDRAENGVNWNEFQLRVDGSANDIWFDLNAAADTGDDTVGSSFVQFEDDALDAGDFVEFCVDSAVAETDVQVTISHIETNTVVKVLEFATVTPC